MLKKMTYHEAIYNLNQAKSIPYRKATFIKIYELLDKLEQESKWIPVTERLPDEEGFYLVTRRITDDVATFIFRCTPTSKDYWKRCATAWMPKPKPYKAESEVNYAN